MRENLPDDPEGNKLQPLPRREIEIHSDKDWRIGWWGRFVILPAACVAAAGFIAQYVWTLFEVKPNIIYACIGTALIYGLLAVAFWVWSDRWPRKWRLLGIIAGAVVVAVLSKDWVAVQYRSQHAEVTPLDIPAVTQISIQTIDIGKPLIVQIEVNNPAAGRKLRGSCSVSIGSGDESAFTLEKRLSNEKTIWEQYKKHSRESAPKLLASISGLMTIPCDGPVITKQDWDILQGPTGVVYIAGQIDYGAGALDYCGYIRPKESGRAFLCIEHNGPTARPVFK